MGINNLSFFDVIQSKVLSWITDLPWVSFGDSLMSDSISDPVVCDDCQLPNMGPFLGQRCRSCGRVFCAKCTPSFSRNADSGKLEYLADGDQSNYKPEFCKVCSHDVSPGGTFVGNHDDQFDWLMPHCEMPNNRTVDSGCKQPLSLPLSCSTTRFSWEDDRECPKPSSSPSSLFSQDISDLETSSFSTGTEFYSFRSSPFVSPNRTEQQTGSYRCSPKILSPRLEKEGLIEPIGDYSESSFSKFQNLESQESQTPFDLESNDFIWLPPSPKGEIDDMKSGFLQYYDDDDDGDVSDMVFKACSFDCDDFSDKERENDATKKMESASVYKDFKALVFHFLKVEGICLTNANSECSWVEIVSSLSWQAANFVRPNTSRGGSMDPVDYIKIKCILNGSSSDSILVKGVVCKGNVKHKRMITQHTNPKVLILGGALEYQKVPDKFASINTVLEQEQNHIKIAFKKMEVHKPNVVLMEKSVSPYFVNYMLDKGISLVSNVKRSLLERISRCTGAQITDSLDDIPSARLGICDAFRIDRVPEQTTGSQSNRKANKTFMFLEGCPRRLGCTVVLRGTCLEELKKVKRAVQYACFAAYHLSLETSFLADEGARLPETQPSPSNIVQEALPNSDEFLASGPPNSTATGSSHQETESLMLSFACDGSSNSELHCNYNAEAGVESSQLCCSFGDNSVVTMDLVNYGAENVNSRFRWKELDGCLDHLIIMKGNDVEQRSDRNNDHVTFNEQTSTAENSQSILVSLSKSCVLKGITCEKPHLFRIKFYGSFDKPLGKFLSDYIFDQMPCQTCKEPMDAHVMSYTHQYGNLTISVKQLPSIKLHGELEGKIWMWHRCLKCGLKNGVPPAGKRVVMSDAAWGLSFGKFLELSFSNHSSANRVAGCGHSLQKDCLRFYGLGSMVACFRYSPVDILLVNLPPPMLDFASRNQQEWLQREAVEVYRKIDGIFSEIFRELHTIEGKILNSEYEQIRTNLIDDIMDLKDLLSKERNEYVVLSQSGLDNITPHSKLCNILELNEFRRSVLMSCDTWNRRIYILDSLLKKSYSSSNEQLCTSDSFLQSMVKRLNALSRYDNIDLSHRTTDNEFLEENSFLKGLQSDESNLSDTIDLAWTGSNQSIKAQTQRKPEAGSEHLTYRKVCSPVRVYSFDSALRDMDKSRSLFSASHLSSSMNATDPYGDLAFTQKDSVHNIRRVYSQHTRRNAQNTRFSFGSTPAFISSASSLVSDGARLLLPKPIFDDNFVAVFDDEPSSIISYAISTKEHLDFVIHASDQHRGRNNTSENLKNDVLGSQPRPSMSAVTNRSEPYDSHSHLHGSGETFPSQISISSDIKQNHFRISFDDESSFPADKIKFSVICYFAKQFSVLRMNCCPNEMDFICSLSRCRKYHAQGGKSNVYFAKSLDDRFIIKQVTKTELDAFEGFAPQYFNYLTESIKSGSPTCLAKILGIYQVSIKHLKGGKEERMDLMVMENIFFERSISRIYDLKGSSRSRYIPDTTGSNRVLLDLNLLEALRTNPIFLRSKAKRRLERAVWNDTAFLASVGVMDYSLLVGVDSERKELVIGTIDFLRQYTWDKQLETWVKASGILGGPKNETPTVVSPDVYKKRFRKAMSSYFLTVPDQWHS